jgi:hypothetical protein
LISGRGCKGAAKTAVAMQLSRLQENPNREINKNQGKNTQGANIQVGEISTQKRCEEY